MKLSAIPIVILLAGITGVAAAQSIETMPPVTVEGDATVVAGCNAARNPDSPECRALRKAVLEHFPAWKLGVIFGAESSHWAYVSTGAKDRLTRDFGKFLAEYEQHRLAAIAKSSVQIADD